MVSDVFLTSTTQIISYSVYVYILGGMIANDQSVTIVPSKMEKFEKWSRERKRRFAAVCRRLPVRFFAFGSLRDRY
jgi:hypothetical protein